MSPVQAILFVAALTAFFLVLRLVGGYAPGWIVRCRRCGLTRSAAQAGMIRLGKTGNASLTVDWCPGCRGVRWHTVEREAPAP